MQTNPVQLGTDVEHSGFKTIDIQCSDIGKHSITTKCVCVLGMRASRCVLTGLHRNTLDKKNKTTLESNSEEEIEVRR